MIDIHQAEFLRYRNLNVVVELKEKKLPYVRLFKTKRNYHLDLKNLMFMKIIKNFAVIQIKI